MSLGFTQRSVELSMASSVQNSVVDPGVVEVKSVVDGAVVVDGVVGNDVVMSGVVVVFGTIKEVFIELILYIIQSA